MKDKKFIIRILGLLTRLAKALAALIEAFSDLF